MHFWIDKRSQTCGFSGRHRVPSSISAGASRRGGLCSRNYYQQTHVKLMVTPVHRFQSIESVANNNARHHHARPLGLHTRPPTSCHHITPAYNNVISSNQNASSRSGNHAHSMEIDSGVLLDAPVDLNHRRTGPSTSADPTVATAHQIIPAGKLKCGMWASFAIVTVFMAGAKFYFSNQSTGMEVLVFCTLLVLVLFAGCTVSLCEAILSSPAAIAVIENASVQPVVPQETTSSVQVYSSNEDLTTLGIQVPTQPVLQSTQQQEPPPPPYHIAVLLPQNNNQQQHVVDDSPPPSYDKAVS